MQVLHFPLPNQLCPVTVVYPCVPLRRGEGDGLSDTDLLPTMRQLHALLNLPADRPQLRTINREYLEGRGQSHDGSFYDTCYHLLCLFSWRDHSLEAMLSLVDSTPILMD